MSLNFFFGVVFLLLSMLQGGLSQSSCNLFNIKVDQELINNSEYKVTLTNNCICSQSNLLLSCAAFKGPEPGFEDKVKVVNGGSDCLINDGQPVFKDYPIMFKYTAAEKIKFNPISSQINCS
ncbi:hypothetical protein QJS04_geneDACA015422 [Acorus gramineus]|uniref:Uncharacterized protein n=1 Tax=Acorus gramineus TaxID=55184 RepID=A0AAV9A4Q1_ACOGR|nr:hypothetical protein QJS04_geneDACA015422 [Acorus gramineus]